MGVLAMPISDLAGILTYHVVSGKVLSTDLTNGMTAKTVNGATVTITIGDTVKVNTATVTSADVMCSNGVIHIIDDMLLPPQSEPEPASAPEPEPEPEPEPSPAPQAQTTSSAQISHLSAFLASGAMLSAFFFA